MLRTTGCWCRFPRCCATTRTCRSCTWWVPTAVMRGDRSRWACAWAIVTWFRKGCTLATRWWRTAASSCNSSSRNERAASAKRRDAQDVAHQPHRRVRAGTAPADRAAVAGDGRGRRVGLQGPADGCVPEPVAADGGHRRAMAGAFGGGSRAADHRADGTRYECDPGPRHQALDLAVWPVRRHADVFRRYRSLLRAPARVQPPARHRLAGRGLPRHRADVAAIGAGLPLRAAEHRSLTDGTQDTR